MFSIDHFVAMEIADAYDAGEDYRADCPFCVSRVGDADIHQHLYISKHKQVVHCFRCEYGASWIKFVGDVTGYPYHRVLGILYQAPSLVKVRQLQPVVDEPTEAELPEDYVKLSKCNTGMANVAKRYMRKRGFNMWYWDRYGLGLSDQYGGRIIIPIEAGYWQGRKFIDWLEPKYLNPKSPNRSILFNSQALYGGADEIVVCEGAFSAMAVNEDAIAIISKEPTVERIERMIQSPPTRYVIALEPGAYGSMGKLMVELSRAGKEVVVWRYSVGDPADPAGRFEVIPFDFKARLSLGFL